MEPDKISELQEAIKAKKGTLAERRSYCIRIYLTAEEERQILDKCQGIAASIYCRAKVLGESAPRPKLQIPEINRRVYAECSKLQSDLNQITRSLNNPAKAGREPSLTHEYLNQLNAINRTLKEVQQELLKLTNESQTSDEGGENNADWEGDL